MGHAWCHDVARDEQVRAAEDGRDRPLPTLGECIDGMFPKSVSASSAVDHKNKGDGMRTERVTLEVEIERGSPPSEWPWSYILSRSDALKMRPGESVRVVDTHAEAVAESVAWEGARDAYRGRILRLTEERDAAIRERDEIRQSWLRSEESGTRLLAERNAALDDADGLRQRVAALEAASGGGEQPRGWLTGEEREAVNAARDYFDDDDHGDSECVFIARVLKQLLARSTPPEVVLDALPTDETGECFSRRDVIKALAAAGVAVKEVG